MMMGNIKQGCLLTFAVIHATYGADVGQQRVEVLVGGPIANADAVDDLGEQGKPLMRRTKKSDKGDASSLAEELQTRADRQKLAAKADALIQLEQESAGQTLDTSVDTKSGKKLMLNDENSYAVVSSTDTTLSEKAKLCVNRAVPAPCGQAKVSSQQNGTLSIETVSLKLDPCDVQGSDQKWQLEGRILASPNVYTADTNNKTFGRLKLDGENLCLYAESADTGILARGCANSEQYMWQTEKDSSTIKHTHTSGQTPHCLAVCSRGATGCTTDAQKSSLYLKPCNRNDCNQKFSLADPR